MFPHGKIAGPALIWGLLCLSLVGAAPAQTPDKSVEAFGMTIDVERHIFLGHYFSLSVFKTTGTEDMHGFDFLIGFDTTVMSFIEADDGELYDSGWLYEWEYFDYHLEAPVSCDSGWCPTGLVRVTGVADINNGDHHPLDLSPEDGTAIFDLVFYLKDDSTNECSFSPVRFFWNDCGDNGIAVEMPPTIGLAVSDKVYDWIGDYFEISDPDFGFPGYFGAPDSCLIEDAATMRFVDFYNGGVDIICADSIDQRGDININGVANEIADWVMFTSYLIWGFEAFNFHIEASIAASDVNADGIALGVEDLVYMWRIICGDALPPPSGIPDKNPGDSLIIIQDLSSKTVSFEYSDSLAAIYLVFKGDIVPEFLIDTADHMTAHFYDGVNTYILIQPAWSSVENCGKGLTEGPLFTYTGFGQLTREGSDYRTTGAGDYNNSVFGPFDPYVILVTQITGGYNGEAAIAPHPLPRYLARIGDSETLSITVGNFTAHDAYDIDLSSVRVNDTIVPLSMTVLTSAPGFDGPVLEAVVSARSFINTYYFGPDTTESPPPWVEFLDTLSIRSFVYKVSGDFTDAVSFNTLGDVAIFDQPATIPVPSGWAAIGEALDAAQAGDTVLVACGTYYEHNILMKDSVCLRSETGYSGCAVIEADSLGRVMIIEGAGRATTITGFTFREGYAPGYPPDGYGGGVFCQEASPVFRDCAFVNNAATDGGGLGCFMGSNPILENCLIANNAAGDAGGGMLCMAGANAELHECIFSGNQAAQLGGGIMSLSSSTPSLTDCLMAFNVAQSGGGMFHDGFASSQTLRLTGCTFAFNIGADYGSALTFSLTSPLVENCVIAFNYTSEAVSCIDEQTHPLFQCSDIYGNEGGDWTGYIADQLGVLGNLSLDPMFCDTTFIDFHLDGLSPCSPLNNICHTLIGAYGVNCGIRCGDNNISGTVDVGDIVFIIAHLFRGGPAPVFLNVADLNGNGEVDVGDAVVLINFIFKDGPPLQCQPE